MPSLTVDEIPELLTRLVDKSLVQVDAGGRYSILSIVRQFGQEEVKNADDSTALRLRHLDYFHSLSRGMRRRASGPESAATYDTLEREYEDFRMAIEQGISSGQTWNSAAEITYEIYALWFARSYLDDGIRLISAVIAAAPPNSDSRLSEMYVLLASLQQRAEHPETMQTIEMASELARRSGNAVSLGRATFIKAMAQWRSGSESEVDSTFQQACDVSLAANDTHILGLVLLSRGNFALSEGRVDDANRYYEEAERRWKEHNNVRGLSILDSEKSNLCERMGDYEGAHRWALESLKVFVPVGDRRSIAACIANCSSGFWVAGDYETAARLLGCCAGILESSGLRLDKLDEQTFHRWEARFKEAMGVEAFSDSFGAGKHMSADDALRTLFARPEPWKESR